VGVATGEPPEVVRDFLAERPLPYPVALDPESRIESELAIYGLPTLMVVDRRGRIAYRHTGLIDADTLRRVLAAAETG
jgi:cytochrome c biogenesis protein CcmG/thiol:disulfide interchange protein DsbE